MKTKYQIDYLNTEETQIVLERITDNQCTGHILCPATEVFKYPLNLDHHKTFEIYQYLKLKQ